MMMNKFFSNLTLTPINELIPHEKINASRVTELAEKIKKSKVFTTPILADKDSKVIIDGHHRYEAASQLNFLKIPCILIDYYSEKILALEKSATGKELKKELIIKNALEGKLYGQKFTFHIFQASKNSRFFHLSDFTQNIVTDIDRLT